MAKKAINKNKANKLSEFIFKGRKVLLPIFLICIIVSLFLIPKYHYVYNTNSANAIKKSENTISNEQIEKKFGKNNTLVILFKNSEKDYSKELELAKELDQVEKINSITSIGGYSISDNIYLGTKVNYLEISKIFNISQDITLKLYQFYANANNELEKLENLVDYRITIIDLINFLNEYQNSLPIPENLKNQITSYYQLIEAKLPLLESSEYTRFILNLDAPVESSETYSLVNDIRKIAEAKYDDVVLVGNTINAIDLEKSFTADNLIITAITVLFIALILIFTFKSFGATLLLILTIEGSILINFGITVLTNKEIFFMGYVVVSAIQMGATIDYAIVITTRYLGLRKKMDKKEAIINTLNDCLPAVITSGSILTIAGFLIGFISTSSVISQIGLFLGVGTLISLIATIFVLPAILYVCDSFIKKTTIKKEK